uniref:BLTX552 n=1 Tax=Nephila pilipes TaxID=299642 RepID=A0A076KZW2_NEPPI|nr:BLTX552 [Nephila pilipes]
MISVLCFRILELSLSVQSEWILDLLAFHLIILM